MTTARGNLHICNTNHGTLNTKIAAMEIPEVFQCIPIVKNVFTCDNV